MNSHWFHCVREISKDLFQSDWFLNFDKECGVRKLFKYIRSLKEKNLSVVFVFVYKSEKILVKLCQSELAVALIRILLCSSTVLCLFFITFPSFCRCRSHAENPWGKSMFLLNHNNYNSTRIFIIFGHQIMALWSTVYSARKSAI